MHLSKHVLRPTHATSRNCQYFSLPVARLAFSDENQERELAKWS